MSIKKHIPNSITLLNLMSGSAAAIAAMNGQMGAAVALTGLAAVFDFFDGFAARLLHVKSETGKELDSLADVVSFGFTPSVILFSLISDNAAMITSEGIAFLLPYASLLIGAFSALRLAKFNLDTRQTDSFLGLPTPANAMFIVSLPLITGSSAIQDAGIISLVAGSLWFQLLLIPASCYLLICEIPLFALKFPNGFAFSANRVKYLFLILSVFALIALKWAGIPVIIILYILISLFSERKKS
jgi:CDP-diacylglycerol--serine O-phosphatidyltransferase